MLSRDDQGTLNDLRFHWEDHYLIDCKDGTWIAAPVADPFAIITADSAMELRTKVRDDYASRASQRASWPVGNSGP